MGEKSDREIHGAEEVLVSNYKLFVKRVALRSSVTSF
jgi:hypothetical protein